MGLFSRTKGGDGEYVVRGCHDSIPKGVIPGLAKGESNACKDASRAELRALAAKDRQRNDAGRKGRN